jgi:hypothetical protein
MKEQFAEGARLEAETRRNLAGLTIDDLRKGDRRHPTCGADQDGTVGGD